MDNITPEGRVLNVSGGTAVMKDREGYRNISGPGPRAGDRDWPWLSWPLCWSKARNPWTVRCNPSEKKRLWNSRPGKAF